MPYSTSDESDVQDEDVVLRIESDLFSIVGVAENNGDIGSSQPDSEASHQSEMELKPKPAFKRRGKQSKNSTPTKLGRAAKKKSPLTSALTVVRMTQSEDESDIESNDSDVDHGAGNDLVESFPNISELQPKASKALTVVPKKRGRPAKAPAAEQAAEANASPKKKKKKKKKRTRMSNKVIVNDDDDAEKQKVQPLGRTQSKVALNPAPQGSNALQSSDADTEAATPGRPSRAAAKSAKTSITAQTASNPIRNLRSHNAHIDQKTKQLYRDNVASPTASKGKKGIAKPVGRGRPRKQSKQSHFEVEELVGSKMGEDGTVRYCVKWLGYSDSENTWEPMENLRGCMDLVFEFDQKQQAKSKNKTKTKAKAKSKKN
ncbi:putative Chromo domain-containing protein [Seiridium unicorne]|uniref:Chromo domain-containing protein n=1 Tax=Seiridium unicorne TaxID=138068 RepID=A0ABR2VFW3_9PEZI